MFSESSRSSSGASSMVGDGEAEGDGKEEREEARYWPPEEELLWILPHEEEEDDDDSDDEEEDLVDHESTGHDSADSHRRSACIGMTCQNIFFQ